MKDAKNIGRVLVQNGIAICNAIAIELQKEKENKQLELQNKKIRKLRDQKSKTTMKLIRCLIKLVSSSSGCNQPSRFISESEGSKDD